MDQTHIGYTFWNEPPLNAMPGVEQVQPLLGARMVVVPEGDKMLALPGFDAANRQTHTIDIANRGIDPFDYSVSASAPWIHLSAATGYVTTDQRIDVSIDWTQAPVGSTKGFITLTQQNSHGVAPISIAVEAIRLPASVPIYGFAESNGVVSIEAEHSAANRAANGVAWQVIPGFGETLSAMEAFPITAPSSIGPAPQTCLDYNFYLYNAAPRTLESILAPTLDFTPDRGLRYSIAVDSRSATVVNAWSSNTHADWAKAVSDGVHKVSTPLGNLAAGQHTLHFCRVDAGVVLEKLVIFSGLAPTTYLGPSESASLPALSTSTGKGAQP